MKAPDFFRNHLNWTYILSWVLSGFVALVAYLFAIVIRGTEEVVPYLGIGAPDFVGMVFVFFTIFINSLIWLWILDNKGQNEFWVMFLGAPLFLPNRNKERGNSESRHWEDTFIESTLKFTYGVSIKLIAIVACLAVLAFVIVILSEVL